MRLNITWLLWSWALLSPILFRILPGRDAAIACLLAGWAFLPVESYPPSVIIDEIGSGGSVHAVAIPSSASMNKATAIGIGCLIGIALFDRRAFVRLRVAAIDLPIVVWCVTPVGSAIANGLPISEGLAQARYLSLAWGVPYLMGRAYLVDEASRKRFALGLVAAGLAYLPICVIEWIERPFLYNLIYGAHPYQLDGAPRIVIYRPMGFLEHGNQLGMWMASSALAATWLRATGVVQRFWRLPAGLVASTLVATVVLCQSHSSIILLGIGLLPCLVHRASHRLKALRVALIAIGSILVIAAFLLAASRGFDAAAVRIAIRDFFHLIRKASITWRLARIEESFDVIFERPLLGHARSNWGRGGLPFVAPVATSFWMHALGIYGLVGLLASMGIWCLPIIRSIGRRRMSDWAGPTGGVTSTLAVILMINALDGFSNAVLILPLLAAAGGLNRPVGPPIDSGRQSG